MSRSFSAGSTQNLTATTVPVAGLPVTMSCWVRTSGTGNRGVALIGKASGNGNEVSLNIGFSREAVWKARQFTTVDVASGGTIAENTWTHIAGTSGGVSDHAVWLSGTETTDTTTIEAIDSQTTTKIGSGTTYGFMDGEIAELGIWNRKLDDAEFAMLAAKVSPKFIRNGLKLYLPMVRDSDNDLVGGVSFTANNTPTISDHPPIYYTSSAFPIVSTGAGDPPDPPDSSSSIAAMQNFYRRIRSN